MPIGSYIKNAFFNAGRRVALLSQNLLAREARGGARVNDMQELQRYFGNMTLDDARRIFGYDKDAVIKSKEHDERFLHMYIKNDPEVGGSAYLQAKIEVAHMLIDFHCVDEEAEAAAEQESKKELTEEEIAEATAKRHQMYEDEEADVQKMREEDAKEEEAKRLAKEKADAEKANESDKTEGSEGKSKEGDKP